MTEEQFLVLAPTGRDAALTCRLLERADLQGRVCRSLEEACEVLDREGAAAIMVAQEALSTAGVACFTAWIARQETWSDLPVLLFMNVQNLAGARPLSLSTLAPLGNVTVLDRPLRAVTMQSAARSALRARRRQYAARAELDAQRAAVTQRDQFLAMLGHELRNPLAAIELATDRMEHAGGDHARYRDILRRQTGTLARLVDDLLDVARVTSGKISVAHAPIDLGELVARGIETQHATAAAQDLRLTYAPPPEPVIVRGDAIRIEQIVMNLVGNAMKYTPAGGTITITVERDREDALLRVRDTGVGIAPEMIDRIFELFAQVEGTLERARGGMGIGLTLVRRLVELHGGAVMVESAGLGEGSCFTVRLPLAVVEEVPASPEAAAAAPAAGKDVLVVEDNLESRELLVELLTDSGHHVASAEDGPTGIARALEHPPNVALIDIGLPGVDGYVVAREVRAALGERVVLIAMTGYGQPDDRRRAFEAGFDLHLTKPVDLRALRRVLGGP